LRAEKRPIRRILDKEEDTLPEPRKQRPQADMTTAKNARLRDQRDAGWRCAEAVTRYWRARMDFTRALSWVQRLELPEGRYHPVVDEQSPTGNDATLVAQWREALVRQLLAPAPCVAVVNWKKAQLQRGEHRHIGVKSERIERAIAEDLAFLAAHPTRRLQNAERIAERRNFKSAMRQRIRDVAATRNLSDEDIKGAMTCKHHEIAKFTEKHGVNVEWLLEGKGRIFKNDKIELNPNMSGAELAAVVRTLPEAEQRTIEAMIDTLLERQP
jgi:hypothetical protein